MNYLKLKLTKEQEIWTRWINLYETSSTGKAINIQNSISIARDNAITILENEFGNEENKNIELIIFYMMLEETQIEGVKEVALKNNIILTKHKELDLKIINKGRAIAYIHNRLKEIERTLPQFVDGIINNRISKEYQVYKIRILNKFLLNILKEEQKKNSEN